MKFCIECGEKIKSSSKFCTSCGTPIPSVNEQNTDEHAPPVTTTNKTSETNKQRTSKTKNQKSTNTKFIIGLVIGLAIVLIIVHKGLAMHFDPMKDIVAMDKAVTDNESSNFLKYITFDDGAIVDEASYFNYIKEFEWNESTKEQYIKVIEKDKQDPSPLDKDIKSVTGDLLFKVKQKTRLLGLYKEYTLHAIPTTLNVYTNIDETEMTIKNSTITIENAEEAVDVGHIYPGTYSVEATAKGKYGDFSYDEKLNITAVSRNEVELNFDSLTYDVYTDYDYKDAVLFIDNQKTKTNLQESFKLGPVPHDSNLKVHAEWERDKDNIVRSNVVQLNEMDGATDIYFTFDVTRSMPAKIAKQEGAEAGQFVLEFRDAYEAAVNYADFSVIEGYLKRDGHAYDDLRSFVKGMEDGYYYYEFDKNEITKITEKKKNVIEVETNELFTFYDDDGKVYDYDREKKYIVENNAGDFQIIKIEYTDTEKSSQ